MILWVFIEFFGIKIVIRLSKNHYDLILKTGFDLSQNIPYLLIFYRYNFIEISGISDISSIFRQFFIYFFDFLANQLSVGNIVSGPIDNRYFDDITIEKTEILFLAHNLPISAFVIIGAIVLKQ